MWDNIKRNTYGGVYVSSIKEKKQEGPRCLVDDDETTIEPWNIEHGPSFFFFWALFCVCFFRVRAQMCVFFLLSMHVRAAQCSIPVPSNNPVETKKVEEIRKGWRGRE